MVVAAIGNLGRKTLRTSRLLDLLVRTDTVFGVGRGVGGCIAHDYSRIRCPICRRILSCCVCVPGRDY